VLDPTTHTVIDTITGFKNPVGLTFTTDSAYAYVTDTNHNAVYVIRTSDNSIEDVILGFSSPAYIAVTPDRTYAFVSNTGHDTVSVIRTSDNMIVHTIPIPTPKSLAVTQDGAFLYVASDFGTVFKVRILDYTILIAIPNFQNPSNLTLTTNNAPGDTVNACQVTFSPTDTFNRIFWQAAPGNPTGYNIYRDVDLMQLIATLPATTFTYKDDNREVGQTYTYYMTADYANGFSSTIGSVEVTPVRTCVQ
jgi:DNA-binding beta-propeller fold protein YncE